MCTKSYFLLLTLLSNSYFTQQELIVTPQLPLKYCLETLATPLQYALEPSSKTVLVSLTSNDKINKAVAEILMQNSTRALKIFKRDSNEERIFLNFNTKSRSYLFVVTNFEEIRRAVNVFRNKPYWVQTIQVYILYVKARRPGSYHRGRNVSEERNVERKKILKILHWIFDDARVYNSMLQIVSLDDCKDNAPIDSFTKLYTYEPFLDPEEHLIDDLRDIPYPGTELAKASASSHWKRMQGFLKIPVDLGGINLNISFFKEQYMDKFPNSTKLEDYDQHIKEIQMMRVMKDYLNASLVIIQPADDGNYGYCNKGVCTGSLNDVVEMKVDMSLNLRFVKQYNTTKIDFSMPITQDKLCIIVPDVGYMKGIYLILSLYTLEVWLLFLVSASTSMVFHKVMSHFAYKLSRNGRDMKKNISFLPPLKALVGIPFKITRIFSLRIQIITCMFVSIIYISLWQGAMFHMARYGQKGRNIDTLSELSDSKRVIYTSYSDLLDTFDGFEKPLNELKDRLKLKANVEQEISKTLKESHSGILIRQNVFYADRTINPHKYSKSRLHVMEECIRTYQLAYIAPKGGSGGKLFKLFMNRIRETGIYEHMVQ
ncbi:hypothetical protein LSTR_LSTR014896, partial [Laodelphax striatellus]